MCGFSNVFKHFVLDHDELLFQDANLLKFTKLLLHAAINVTPGQIWL